MFGRKTRAQKVKAGARAGSLAPVLAAAYGGARPVAERLLYDDDLRDNIRTIIESTRKILDEVSNEEPTEIVSKLWGDDKLRSQVETAAGAAQEGVKRARGQKVKSRGGGGGRLLLILALVGGFLFLNPKTGPQARRIAQDVVNSLRSG